MADFQLLRCMGKPPSTLPLEVNLSKVINLRLTTSHLFSGLGGFYTEVKGKIWLVQCTVASFFLIQLIKLIYVL